MTEWAVGRTDGWIDGWVNGLVGWLDVDLSACLPFLLPTCARRHELEADRIGLFIAANAGYNPAVAPSECASEGLSERGKGSLSEWARVSE